MLYVFVSAFCSKHSGFHERQNGLLKHTCGPIGCHVTRILSHAQRGNCFLQNENENDLFIYFFFGGGEKECLESKAAVPVQWAKTGPPKEMSPARLRRVT